MPTIAEVIELLKEYHEYSSAGDYRRALDECINIPIDSAHIIAARILAISDSGKKRDDIINKAISMLKDTDKREEPANVN